MRRRIEETRARLKAKAFDAMMSGEAALLSRDSGDKPVPSADDVAIDAETDSAIDESLSRERYRPPKPWRGRGSPRSCPRPRSFWAPRLGRATRQR